MTNAEIVKYLNSHVEPVATSAWYKRIFRASAYLRDGIYLPCVIFTNTRDYLNLALHRLEKTSGTEYSEVLKSFIASGNTLASDDIERVEISPYALPPSHLREIANAGETAMGSVSFTAEMADGSEISFLSTFDIEFFDLPQGYSMDQIVRVHPHKSLAGKPLRELPAFVCYIHSI